MLCSMYLSVMYHMRARKSTASQLCGKKTKKLLVDLWPPADNVK